MEKNKKKFCILIGLTMCLGCQSMFLHAGILSSLISKFSRGVTNVITNCKQEIIGAATLASVFIAGFKRLRRSPVAKAEVLVQPITPMRAFLNNFSNEGYLRRGVLQFQGGTISGNGIVVPVGQDNICIQQVCVHNQFSDNGGGGASCAYHGLKNACGISLMHAGDASGHDLLENPATTLQLFALPTCTSAPGVWRQFVIQQQDKRALKYYISKKIQVKVAEAWLTEGRAGRCALRLREKISTLVDDFVTEIVEELINRRENFVEATVDSFTRWLQRQQIPISNPQEYGDESLTAQHIVHYIKLPRTIQSCVETKGNMRFSLQDIELARGLYNSEAQYTGLFNPLEPNGEWAHEGELLHMISYARQQYQQLAHVPFIPVDSVSPAMLDDNETIVQIRQAIRDGRALNNQVYAFVVATMNVGGEDGGAMTGSAGHWMTLVLDTVNGNRRYTMADSAGNAVRLYSGPCYELIRYLEGDQVAQAISLPRNHFRSGPMGMLAYNWNRLGILLDS